MSERRSLSSRKGVPHKRPRKRLSCEPCRNSKLRCNRQQPCSACRRRECESACTFLATRQNATREASPRISSETASEPLAQPHSLVNLPSPSPAVAAPSLSPREHRQHPFSPSGTRDILDSQQSPQREPLSTISSLHAVLERPTLTPGEFGSGLGNVLLDPFAFGPKVPVAEILAMLPSSNCREYLIARYFTYQAPLFHVLHGPSFQKQYADFIQESVPISLPWLALLFAVCSSAIQTLDAGDPILKDYWSTSPDILERDPTILSRHLRGVALTCLSEARFMVHYNLHTLEALLIMIYGICHSEGVDRGWIFLGIALNMGIALRCNTDSQDLNCIEKQRRRRCWAGILMLHTYQGILFRDIDMSFLLTIPSIMPADVNDADINEDRILEPSVRPTSMSLMHFKTRLFNLSTRICSRLSNSLPLNETTMKQYDGLIASEQQQWDSTYLPGGSPNLLDTASYAYWCILQTYAHQLYLLIHRPFYHSQSSQYLPSSREKYLQSSMSLIDLHQQIDELPILRPYRWLVNGMTSFNALQGAVALAGCLVDTSDESDTLAPHRETFDSAVHRIKSLQKSSPVCARAYQALENLQTQLARSNDNSHESLPQDWDINSGWLDLNAIDYDWWDNLINNINGDIPGDGTGVY